MTGHTGSITELHFTTDGANIVTASTDYTLGLWDIVTGQRVKRFKGAVVGKLRALDLTQCLL